MNLEVFALIVVAVISASGGWAANRFGRTARLEQRLARVERVNRRMWLHMRAQVDHAYRSGITPLTIPDDLFGEEDTE